MQNGHVMGASWDKGVEVSIKARSRDGKRFPAEEDPKRGSAHRDVFYSRLATPLVLRSWRSVGQPQRLRPRRRQLQPKSSHAEPAGDLAHLGRGKLLPLLNGLFHAAKNRFFEKLHVIRIHDVLLDLD